ncbi:MAG: hypothetical protein ACO3F2_09675 [Roseiflexaceae bacterium]
MTLAACSRSNSSFARGVTTSPLTLWSTLGSIDRALARWRRFNPDVNVRRQIFDAPTLLYELEQLPSRTRNIPDVIFADSYTMTRLHNLGLWRYVDTAAHRNSLVAAAISHATFDDQRLVGLPLTCNPLQIWYQSNLLQDVLGIRDNIQVQAAVGTSWESFESFIRQIHRNNPVISTVASCVDDICYPLAIHAMQQQQSILSAFNTGINLAQQHIIGRATHFGGVWFDLLKRNNVAIMVGGRSLGRSLTRTWSSDTRSPWQTVPHPLGALYGPNIIAAIPLQASNYEQAAQLIDNFVYDIEMQAIISNESGSVPALRSAYDHPELQKVDSILPERTIRDAWSIQNADSVPMLLEQQIRQLQQAQDAMYRWQNGSITDNEVRVMLGKIG